MVDRRSHTITFKLPITATLSDLKKSLDKESQWADPTVIQELRAGQFLVEFKTKEQAEQFIDSGLDFDTIHIECRPPQKYYINGSIRIGCGGKSCRAKVSKTAAESAK